MEFILVVFISGGMVENSQNGVSRSLSVIGNGSDMMHWSRFWGVGGG